MYHHSASSHYMHSLFFNKWACDNKTMNNTCDVMDVLYDHHKKANKTMNNTSDGRIIYDHYQKANKTMSNTCDGHST